MADSNKNDTMNPHFFRRDANGDVRLRLRLSGEEAALIEEGAGETPLILYIHRVLSERANYHIRKRAEEMRRRGLAPETFEPTPVAGIMSVDGHSGIAEVPSLDGRTG